MSDSNNFIPYNKVKKIFCYELVEKNPIYPIYKFNRKRMNYNQINTKRYQEIHKIYKMNIQHYLYLTQMTRSPSTGNYYYQQKKIIQYLIYSTLRCQLSKQYIISRQM